ncbi:hypothetical protein DXG03_008269 [Asterophora parasitica]|uniref:Uncharacterized protein n=1 Tax=Asterophora parasitica TaxID=117018 RepID=A0A9P7GC63_9AGAR|nr:hypothetical protein DXG03_008269 [Asterophora parasitica]
MEGSKLGTRDRDLMSSSSLALIVKSIAELGGPIIEASDIEWAIEIPAGQSLIKWLADLHVAPESDDVSTRTLEQDLGAALRAIALESDEIKIHASQRIAKTIASLEAAIEREDSAIARFQERLSELSVLADIALSSGTQSAISLLDTLAHPTEDTPLQNPEDQSTHPSLASPTRSLTRLADLRAALTEQHTTRVSQLAPSAPKDLLDDAASLSRRFNALLRPGSDEKLKEAAYAVELRRIYESLGQDGASLDLILKEDADPHIDTDKVGGDEGDSDHLNVNVKELLEQAWMLDQAAALEAECAAHDAAIQAHKDTLLPELEALHTSLSERERAIRAAEAWVGAFGIQVEGISSDVADPDLGRSPAQTTDTDESNDAELEQEVKRLLSEHHHKHSGGDDAPLLLLERADMVAELCRIREALKENEKGDGWRDVVLLRENLGSLDASHHSLLDVMYGRNEVQTNATPPFGRSQDVKRLEQRAREAVTLLEAGVGKGEELEKILDGKRTQRKLGEFVHRWTEEKR